jgi:hypothetical protein
MIMPAQEPNAGSPSPMSLRSGSKHVEGDREPPQRRRLAAGDHQPVHAVEFLRAADRRWPRPGGLERTQVLGHVALQGEHADDGLHASSGSGGYSAGLSSTALGSRGAGRWDSYGKTLPRDLGIRGLTTIER